MRSITIAIFLLLACLAVNAQQSEWAQFTSVEGGFSISMPGDTTTGFLNANAPAGYTAPRVRTVSYTDQTLNNYSVTYSSYSEGKLNNSSSEKTFNQIRDVLLRSEDTRLISENDVYLDGFKGREVVIEKAGGDIVTQRFFLVDNHFYQISAQGKKFAYKAQDVKRFFDSFRLLSNKAK